MAPRYINQAAGIVNHGRCVMKHLHGDALGKECDGVDVTHPHSDSFVFMGMALNSTNVHIRANLNMVLDRYRPEEQSDRLDVQRRYCKRATLQKNAN